MNKPVPELLDESRLEGVVPVSRLLGPPLEAMLVDKSSLGDGALAIEHCCQRWAGALNPLIPATSGEMRLAPPWDDYLRSCDVEYVCSNDLVTHDGVVMNFYSHVLREGRPGGNFILKVIHARGKQADWYKSVQAARPSEDSPWFIAYAGCLGLLPSHPDAEAVRGNGFLPELEFADLIRVESPIVENPSAEDLLARLRDPATLVPTSFSAFELNLSQASWNTPLSETTPLLPHQANDAERIGPNIVVLYEPGSVEDLCLIWNLRAAHGLPSGLPLAIPTTADVPAVLDAWKKVTALTSWGPIALRLALVSASVSRGKLEEAAQSSPDISDVVSPADVLQSPGMPGRSSTDVATFTDGEATAAAWSSADREAFPIGPTPRDFYHLKVRIRPRNRALPPSKWMQRRTGAMPGPRGGCWETNASKPDDLARISWPSGWTVLSSLAHDKGLRVQPSPPGRAAASLLRRLGSVHALIPVLDARLIAELNRLCEREGMSWFRKELRRVTGRVGASERPSTTLSSEIDDLLVCRGETEDGQLLTYSRLKNRGVFRDRRLTERWLAWAEDVGLVVRGVGVRCDRCGATSWRAMGELSQAPVCRGCGNSVDRPYPADQIVFHYRASELLAQVTRWDALVHLLAMRYFCEVFRAVGDKPARLFGAYPGVDFYSEETGKPMGEADVVLVFTTGEMAIGECKRSAHGLKDADIRKLEDLCEKTGAEWSFIATLASAADCPAIWSDSERRLPAPPRFVLTAEHLLKYQVFWAYGADPFAWPNADGDEESPEPAQDWSNQLLGWLDGDGGWDTWIASE